MFLLDTNILSLLHSGNETVKSHLAAARMPIATTVVTEAEILRARYEYLLKAADSQHLLRAQEWLTKSLEFLATYIVIRIDENVATTFESLKQQKGLRSMGRADMLIACVALTYRATLVTGNTKDFAAVPRLKLVDWTR